MKRPARSFLTASAAIAMALGLAACGDSAEPAAPADPPAGTADSGNRDDAGTDDNADDGGATTSEQSAETAAPQQEGSGAGGDAIGVADLAEAAVENGRPVDLDWDDDDNGEWDVDVFDGSVIHEVRVTGDTVAVTETDDVDDDDLAEINAATVTIQEAIATAVAATPGTVRDVELDDDDDSTSVRWEVDIDTGSGEVEVHVDAATGEILN